MFQCGNHSKTRLTSMLPFPFVLSIFPCFRRLSAHFHRTLFYGFHRADVLSFLSSGQPSPQSGMFEPESREHSSISVSRRKWDILTLNQEAKISIFSRLARRGGVKRISAGIYDETRMVLKMFLTQVSHPRSLCSYFFCLRYADHMFS